MKEPIWTKFKVGRRVVVSDKVEHYAGKHGVVEGTGVQLGYPVVRVRIDGRSAAATFAPEELKLL